MILKKPQNLRAIIVTGLLVAAILVIRSFVNGDLGQIGPDSDDSMRLVQIRDFLAGQSWFDVTQYRLGPEGGTQMHWSRIVDLPLIILISFFDLFLPTPMAEAITVTIWPLICAGLTVYGALVGIRHVSDGKAIIVACLLLFLTLIGYFKFLPGSIDHHNFQLALIAIAVGHALDPEHRTRSFVISAIAMALSLSIGPEVYLFIAVLCGYFTLLWLFKPESTQRATKAMGVSFAITLILIFFGTIAPRNYGVIHCDGFSLITVLACVTGGVGLALNATMLSDKSFRGRLAGLALLAAVCIVIFLFQAPQCLDNPLLALPEEVQDNWLNYIDEAQPLFRDRSTWVDRAPYALGPVVVAIICAIRYIRKGIKPEIYGFLLALLLLCMALTIYQVRFIVFGHVFSLFVLGPWIADLYVEGKQKGPDHPNVKYTGALALSIPMFWGLPGVMLFYGDELTKNPNDDDKPCYTQSVF